MQNQKSSTFGGFAWEIWEERNGLIKNSRFSNDEKWRLGVMGGGGETTYITIEEKTKNNVRRKDWVKKFSNWYNYEERGVEERGEKQLR